MGNKKKEVKRSKKISYKSNAKHLLEVRKRKLENIDHEDVKNAKRPRFTENGSNEEAELSYHELLPVELSITSDIENTFSIQTDTNKHTSSTPGTSAAVSLNEAIRRLEQIQTDDSVNNSTETHNCPEKIGRRIINVSHFLERLTKISAHGPLGCDMSCLELVGEKLIGLHSKFTFKCKMCNQKFFINSDEDDCVPINTCAVAATITIGCGHSQLEEFSSAMNLPLISPKTYKAEHNFLSENWQQLALESMTQAAEEEKNMAISEGRVTKDGTPIIDVVADGVYSKRSYKKNYSALSGAGAIIGRKTGKILYLGVRNKYCYNCDRAEKKNTTVAEHFCSKNYDGPSTGMESEIIVEGFKQSLSTHGLIYGRLISDGDSSTYSKILQARPYRNITVEKVECRNHLLRNFCNKMQSLQTDTKFLKTHRNLLTTSRIKTIRFCITKAIKKNKNDPNPEEQFLFDDILLTHQHAFGNHLKCKSYFCEKVGKLEQEAFPKDFHLGSLWQRICIMMQGIAGHARSLLHDVDSNVVEHYHSIIAKYVGGKRINFSLKNSYETRCVASAVSFNEERALSKLYKKIHVKNKSPRGKLKMLEERRKRQLLLGKKYAKKRRRLIYSQKKTDKDYGQACEKPDVPEDILNAMKNDFVKNLKKSDEERATIERKTILQRANGEWLEMRRSLLTASNFSRVIKRRANTPCANLVKDLLYRKNIDHVESISHGQKNEKTALAQLASQEGINIRPCGLFIDKETGFLGATPDGLTGEDTVVEVKCPLTANKIGLAEAIQKKKVNFWKKNKKGELEINTNHAWYFQIQGQLHITEKRFCLFAVWSNQNEMLKTETIEKDDQFWEKQMKNKLVTFYMDCILPELLDPRISRNMTIREPYIQNSNSDLINKQSEETRIDVESESDNV